MYHFYSMWFLVPVFTILCNMKSKIFFSIKKYTFQNAWREHLCNLHSNPLNLGHVDTIWSPSRTFEICTEKDKAFSCISVQFLIWLKHSSKICKQKQTKNKNFIITWKTCGAVTPSGSSDPLRPTEFWEESKPGQIPTKSKKTKVIDFKTNW